MKNTIKQLTVKIVNVLFYGIIFLILLCLFHVFCFTRFDVPTNSMYPTLLPGDKIVVNKMIKGARLFNIWATINNKDVSISRLPGWGNFHRNDVLVFNFPYPNTFYRIDFDVMKYYAKRCIALPGDTLEIIDGYYHIHGISRKKLGYISNQDSLWMLRDKYKETIYEGTNWTRLTFGPFIVPQCGQTIILDRMTYLLYQRLICWEQNKRIDYKKGVYHLGDSIISSYTFKENYYFMGGDNVFNSIDSRYWGVVPETFIVGKVIGVYYSADPTTHKIRWNRFFKSTE